jgi:hypothetical protein
MESTQKSSITTIGIATELYEMIDTLRGDERKRTIKEAAEELLRLGFAIKRGEYVIRSLVEAVEEPETDEVAA